jgi:hypothetical protein
MLSLQQAEIETLEKARQSCADSGLQRLVEGWLREQQRKLTTEDERGPASMVRRFRSKPSAAAAIQDLVLFQFLPNRFLAMIFFHRGRVVREQQ